ncbi:Dihydroorotate dehydrogenase [Aphelenchoides fujianensis]|nr:Dihydroorotate dehydrogenase [Aphelenchoides fujianensis]
MSAHLKPARLVKLIGGAGVAFVAGQLAWGSERFYNEVFMPGVQTFVDAETGHKLAVKMAAYGLTPRFGANHKPYDSLKCDFLGMRLNNPIGIAAGFDKNGEAIRGLESSGFGFVEIGSVTPLPQEGNPKPRVFRLLEDRALINRYGFNNHGVGPISERVKRDHRTAAGASTPLGVNLGKNKDTQSPDADYEIGVNYFANHCDYLVINVSSPNTPGLRALQSKAELEKICETVRKALDRVIHDRPARPKVLLKITSDLSTADRQDVARVVLDKRNGVDGLIISNTTIERPSTLQSEHKAESGGLSGPPLRDPSTKCIAEMYKLTSGQVPIVGCGGIESGADAYEKIRAGASVVQLYTALVYQGWPVIGRIKRELNDRLYQDGFTTVTAAIGADHPKESLGRPSESSTEGGRSWWKFW